MVNKIMSKYNAIDLFSGCGGLSRGLRSAGFAVVAALDNDKDSVATYRLNHPKAVVLEKDIRNVKMADIKAILKGNPLHLLAGCPPCQGFSAVRRLNRKRSIKDERNSLVLQILRFVRVLKPATIMIENVPALKNYYLFGHLLKTLKSMGYHIDYGIADISKYGVPQRRKRLVLVGSLLGEIKIAQPTGKQKTVRDAIGKLESTAKTRDKVHKIFASHSPEIRKLISMIPKNGGSRNSLPKKFELDCHKKKNVGFNDIYGRMKWDAVSPTITGGCLNPSKGRFLHPDKNRALTAREAALLQSFPKSYKFPTDISTTKLALLIGNALPPEFSRIQSENILSHIKQYNG